MTRSRRARIALRAIVFCAVLTGCLGACATTEPSRRGSVIEPRAVGTRLTGACKPFFISPTTDSPENVPPHSCWNRLWEVPTALAIAPVAIVIIVGVVASPIWVPLLLLP